MPPYISSTWSLLRPSPALGCRGLSLEGSMWLRVCRNRFAGGAPLTSGQRMVMVSMWMRITSTTGKLAGQKPPTMTMKSPIDAEQCPERGSLLSSKKVEAKLRHFALNTFSASARSSGVAWRLPLVLAPPALLLPADAAASPPTSKGSIVDDEEKHVLQGRGMLQRGVWERLRSCWALTISGSRIIFLDIMPSSIFALCLRTRWAPLDQWRMVRSEASRQRLRQKMAFSRQRSSVNAPQTVCTLQMPSPKSCTHAACHSRPPSVRACMSSVQTYPSTLKYQECG
mmetsp:Transcript_10760/g.27088  ORF Transcript_10760/g.27088 Transcript_10760/m.27088 type:complete len:284 (-) Transcript_10760:142-993(-)